MKSRNKAILILGVLGIIIFGVIQGIIIYRIAANKEQQAPNRPDPLTQDFGSISKYKSSYMGDASNLANLFYVLPLNDIEMSFQLHPEIFTAEIKYKAAVHDIGEEKLHRALVYNATAAFALIDNLEEVRFKFEEATYKILRSNVEKWYGVDLNALTDKEAWEEKVQSKLVDNGYVQSCIMAMVSQAKERTPIEEALLSFYENTREPIEIYEQVPFEEGTLVLAQQLGDGERYPDLHFLDADNKITQLTRGSYCWSLNYTQFKGHYIYFGLAGVETRQNRDNQIPVEKVEALYSDKTVSVIPREKIIAHIDPMERDSRQFRNPQGYIMLTESREIPGDFMVLLENGTKMSLSKRVIKSSSDTMPAYLKSKKEEVYNSFAFTFSPMLTPLEWDKGYKEGEIYLQGKTDNNGNLNALYLRPSGHMSLLDSFILPQDIKPLYLSDNYTRAASFSSGETVVVKYPEKRELLDCRILGLTMEKVEEEIGQDRFEAVIVDDKGQLQLPKAKGHYLFLLRTAENIEIQTYTGILIIK